MRDSADNEINFNREIQILRIDVYGLRLCSWHYKWSLQKLYTNFYRLNLFIMAMYIFTYKKINLGVLKTK